MTDPDLQTRANKERELLLRLLRLNEEFLKNIVALEKRNLELEEQIALHARAAGASQAKSGEPYRILVIDDEPAVLQLFGLILEGDEYEVVMAEDGEDGLSKFKEQKNPLVITDKNLPGINGLEVMREVKQIEPDTEIMMITGFGSKESAIEALNLGATAFLEKPFDNVDEVLAKVDEVVIRQKEEMRKRRQLEIIKDRNREFLDNYRAIRTDLEEWLSLSEDEK
jgi:DNA-binding NtrC family response regulator